MIPRLTLDQTLPLLRLAAHAAFLLAAFVAGFQWKASIAEAEIAQVKAGRDFEREQLATAQTRAVEQARTEERRAALRIQENLDAEHLLRLAREAGERRAVAAVAGLRDDTATYRAALAALASADSTASRECRAAAETAGLCAGLLLQCETEGLEVARFAEDSHAAARTCVGTYRALIVPRLGDPPR